MARGCRIQRVQTREDFLGGINTRQIDLILSDFSLPQFDGLSALKLAHQHAPTIPFIFLSGTIGEDNAVRALQQGATDYVIKDRMRRLVPAIHSALVRADETAQRRTSEKQFHDLFQFAADAIVMMDPAGRITMANLQTEKLFGYGRADLVGQPITKAPAMASAQAAPPDLRKEFVEGPKPRTLSAGQSKLRGVKQDGKDFPVDVSLSPLASWRRVLGGRRDPRRHGTGAVPPRDPAHPAAGKHRQPGGRHGPRPQQFTRQPILMGMEVAAHAVSERDR